MQLKYSKLTYFETNRLLEHFVAGTPARTAALLVGVNRNSVNGFYHRLRVMIQGRLFEEMEELASEVEVDEKRLEKSRYLICSSAAARCSPAWLKIPVQIR